MARMTRAASKSSFYKTVTLFFSYSPPPRLIPHGHRPSSQGVDFESFFGRFRSSCDSKSRLENDSTTTEKRLEIDSLGGGSVAVRDESKEVGCS